MKKRSTSIRKSTRFSVIQVENEVRRGGGGRERRVEGLGGGWRRREGVGRGRRVEGEGGGRRVEEGGGREREEGRGGGRG